MFLGPAADPWMGAPSLAACSGRGEVGAWVLWASPRAFALRGGGDPREPQICGDLGEMRCAVPKQAGAQPGADFEVERSGWAHLSGWVLGSIVPV